MTYKPGERSPFEMTSAELDEALGRLRQDPFRPGRMLDVAAFEAVLNNLAEWRAPLGTSAQIASISDTQNGLTATDKDVGVSVPKGEESRKP